MATKIVQIGFPHLIYNIVFPNTSLQIVCINCRINSYFVMITSNTEKVGIKISLFYFKKCFFNTIKNGLILINNTFLVAYIPIPKKIDDTKSCNYQLRLKLYTVNARHICQNFKL